MQEKTSSMCLSSGTHTHDIYYSSGVRSTIHVGGVRIFSGNLSSREMSKYDEVRVIVSSLEFRVLRFIDVKCKMSLYILDGQPIPLDFKYPLRKLLAQYCNIFFDNNLLH